ncbi:MAG TPA: aspartyl protease family protein [Terriglobales bacterium]|nr:aspartyl protease family protein [Terriglobales bacterium]
MRARPGAARIRSILLATLAPAILAAGVARATWLEPDPSVRAAQLELRLATRDTVGKPASAALLDTLAEAHLALANVEEAKLLFARALALAPGDPMATARLGRVALFQGQPARAESLLERAAGVVSGVEQDLYAARLRLGRWKDAAALADVAGQPGRAALLRRLDELGDAWEIEGPDEIELPLARCSPVPLVKAKLNGQSVLFAIDPATADVILDLSAARRTGVTLLPDQTPVFWSGSRLVGRDAVIQRLELGPLRIGRVPASATSLRRWSLEANPQGETVAGVIGLHLLERFTPTLDLRKCDVVLRRAGTAPARKALTETGEDAVRVPFELWGEGEITVYGSLNGGRRMALWLGTGIPGCAVAASPEVFEEVGVRAGPVSRAVGGAGALLRGPRWNAVQVPTIAVGPVAKDGARGWSGAYDPGELWRHGVRRDAALSSEFLRGRRVTIDWERMELVVE